MDPNKRPDDMVRITTPELAQAFIDEQVAAVRKQIGCVPFPAVWILLLQRLCCPRPSASSSSACT